MDKDIDKIVELGKVLLNTPTLRSIYKDTFEIISIDFEFIEKTTNSQFTSKYEHYIFGVTLYTDIKVNFDKRIENGEIEGYMDIESELWDYNLDPIYLADIIIPNQILNIILPKGGPKLAIELTVIGDEGQIIWRDDMFGRPASSQFH
tara:strand:- start:30 stop:473 length:444 start_codon:yes stop_codon:yes gene_type:complete